MIHFHTLSFLFQHRVPQRILDIGTQNVLRASEQTFREFLDKYGHNEDHQAAAADLAHRSIVRPGEKTLFLSEVLEHTPVDYVSFDVCPGHKTEILDLNRENLPVHYNGAFDLILNCGTSEHILNQLNVFKLIHCAASVGAFIYHQVPTTGRIDHGYFCYHPRLFRELAQANGYEIVDIWFQRGQIRDPVSGLLRPRSSSMAATGIKVKGKHTPEVDIPNHSIGVLFKKTRKDDFRLPLELHTRHAEPDEGTAALYGWTLQGIGSSHPITETPKGRWHFLRHLLRSALGR